MTVRLKNTALDRTKAHLHRTAPKLEMEPSMGGVRIRMGESIPISDEQYARNKAQIDQWVEWGVIEVLDAPEVPKTDPEGLRLDGPTMEQWVAAGYPADRYPPQGYAIKPSAGLEKFLAEQKAAEEAAAKAKQDAEIAALANVPAVTSVVQVSEVPESPPISHPILPPVAEPSPAPDVAPVETPASMSSENKKSKKKLF